MKLKPLSLKNVKTYPLKKRQSKVSVRDFGSSWTAGSTMSLWLESLPNILAGNDLRELVNRLKIAVKEEKTIILAMGAHTIKVGLSPIILDLMERGIITGIAMNGAGIIHDLEVAMVGATSEDVDNELSDGKFGMAEETGEFLNSAIREGAKKGSGLGDSVGSSILKASFPYSEFSLLAGAARMNIPCTVHVAIGTDIIHFHPSADGSAIGKTSHLDFRIFASLISHLDGGAYINLGSAVVLPEVFLKALTLVRNLGFTVNNFTTVDMDFIRHYRPMTNVVKRPTLEGGEGFSLTGHNEIMFPMLAAALIEGLENKKPL
jgi:deoxyhypusine synthase